MARGPTGENCCDRPRTANLVSESTQLGRLGGSCPGWLSFASAGSQQLLSSQLGGYAGEYDFPIAPATTPGAAAAAIATS